MAGRSTSRYRRTTIDIDDELMQQALKLIGIKTKREVVDLALRTLVRLFKERRARDRAGNWEAGRSALRTDDL